MSAVDLSSEDTTTEAPFGENSQNTANTCGQAKVVHGTAPSGKVSAVAFSPRFGCTLGVGLLDESLAAPGTRVRVCVPQHEPDFDPVSGDDAVMLTRFLSATVTALPFKHGTSPLHRSPIGTPDTSSGVTL